MNPGLQKNYLAGAAIAPFRIVKLSAAETVIQAAAATDAPAGVSNEVGPAAGERCDVIKTGIAYVEAGAAIALGAPITADSIGRGITAAPAAGVNNRYVGFAEQAATAAGDVIAVWIEPGVIQG